MQLTVLVNNARDVKPKQTTSLIIHGAAQAGHQVYVTGVADLSCWADGQVWGQVIPVEPTSSPQEMILGLNQTEQQEMPLTHNDVILIRTNPARDDLNRSAHPTSLLLLCMVQEAGTPVLNNPAGLIRAASKIYLQALPASVRPQTLVSYQHQEIIAFIRRLDGPAVLKPLQGTRGNDVFVVQSADDKNLQQIIVVLLRQGAAMVQSFVPEATEGDVRVMVLAGRILEINGQPAAFRRRPGQGDFRSNLHAGGHAEPATITPVMREVVDKVGPYLQRDGIFLAGLDFIGSKIVEINVFSPGGFGTTRRFTGLDFTQAFLSEVIKTIQNYQIKGSG